MGTSLLLLDLAQWHDLLNQELAQCHLEGLAPCRLWELARCRLLLLLGGQEWLDSHLHMPSRLESWKQLEVLER